MPCCNFNSRRILCITTDMLILVDSCYSYVQRKRVGIVKLCCLTYELAKVTIGKKFDKKVFVSNL